jgi:hypothetical protein
MKMFIERISLTTRICNVGCFMSPLPIHSILPHFRILRFSYRRSGDSEVRWGPVISTAGCWDTIITRWPAGGPLYHAGRSLARCMGFELFMVVRIFKEHRVSPSFGGIYCLLLEDGIIGWHVDTTDYHEFWIFQKVRGCIQNFPDLVIRKYTLNFGITCCCPLQNIPLPSLCNGSSVSATAGSTSGTDFLESLIGRSTIVPEFQWHPRNDALLASTSFSETRRNRKGPNQTSKEGGGPQPCFRWPKIAAQTKQCAVCNQSWFRHLSGSFRRTCSLRRFKTSR